jgi:16S rRNA (guanine527-N7)-methyltransferase
VAARAALLAVLGRARDRGFLGPGDPAGHLDHARGFVEVVERLGPAPERVADLGSGGGVPGLVLAIEWPAVAIVLVESSVKRAGWLAEARADLGRADRVEICAERAEELAHDPHRREAFDLVTARSFGSPPVTAEIGTGFLRVGGLLVVSEPPSSVDRWPEGPLGDLGLGPADILTARGAHFACFRKVRPAPAAAPRRRGRPAKRPLWQVRST